MTIVTVERTRQRPWIDGASIPADAMRRAVVDVAPVLIAIVPLALVIGGAIAESSVPNASGLAGAPLLFSGAAHLAVVTMIGGGASLPVVLLAVAVINGRFVLYSAALAPRFASQPRWFRLVAPHVLIDQLFALVSMQLDLGRHAGWIRAYYLTAAAAIAIVWIPGVALGIALGPAIPETWHLEFAAPAMFVGLLTLAVGGRKDLAVAGVAAAVAVAAWSLPGGIGLLTGALAGLGVSSLMKEGSS